MKKKNIILGLLIAYCMTCNSMVNDTTYIICNDSSMIKKNITLVQKNKELKARNVVSTTFAGIGFITTIVVISILTRP